MLHTSFIHAAAMVILDWCDVKIFVMDISRRKQG